MKNILFQMMAFLCVFSAFSQENKISTDLPQIISPSPSVAALMKFEEYPVNNYTGIPNISIPLGNFVAKDGKLAIDLSLKYHPAAAAASEVAGNVGLGWSLQAGGSISRTVRGMPDEFFDGNKIGMWHPLNNGTDILTVLATNPTNPSQQTAIWTYLYDVIIRGRYDSEFDLYQYNFMGYTGRFYVNKSKQVVKLSVDNLKITYNQNTDSFVINDDKGYKYTFGVTEKTGMTTLFDLTYFDSTHGAGTPIEVSNYTSSWHISSIQEFYNSSENLIEFKYSTTPQLEITNVVSSTRAEMLGYNINDIISQLRMNCGNPPQEIQKLEPMVNTATTSTRCYTRKLEQILVKGVCKVEFENLISRSDYNLDGTGKSRVKSIKIFTEGALDEFTPHKYFNLNYKYSEVAERPRLLLNDIVYGAYKDSVVVPENLNYKFEYDDYYNWLGYYSRDEFGIDYWGYYTGKRGGNERNKETSKELCTADMLQKIVYPTDGSTVFKFESNTYYGDPVALTNFDGNPDNWNETSNDYPLNGNQIQIRAIPMPLAGEITTVTIKASSINSSVQLQGLKNNTWHPLGLLSLNETTLRYYQNTGNDSDYYAYQLQYNPGLTENPTPGSAPSAYIWWTAKTRLTPLKEWLYGGGVRIGTIGYFTENVNRDYYKNELIASDEPAPVKETKFDYRYFGNSLRSSGYLVSKKPVFEYELTRKHTINCNLNIGSFAYKYINNQSVSSKLVTQGALIGYENVTVYETGNGKSEYIYTAPNTVSDNIVAEYHLNYPYIPLSTFDYKKGLLLNESVYNEEVQSGQPNVFKKLKETIYSYPVNDMLNFTEITGVKVYISVDWNCPGAYNTTYPGYMSDLDTCLNSPPPNFACNRVCGFPDSFISFALIREYYGWAKLSSKVTKDYFYSAGNSTPNVIENVEEYTYNNTNLKLSSVKKYTSGSFLKTDYEYFMPSDGSNRMSELKKVTEYRGQRRLSTTTTNFNITSPYRPKSITTSKGIDFAEDRIEFLSYDAYGHIKEVKKSNGITYSYIYGYNNSQPIAMFENASYANITTALGAPVSTLNENSDFSNLRNVMPSARISNYTYELLVGLKTVTDARKQVTSYEYDSFGRLKLVKDNEGNIISENNYHYRTQTN